MLDSISPLTALRSALSSGEQTPQSIADETIAHANSSASRNTYLHFDPADLRREAQNLETGFPRAEDRPPLYGVPFSLKDCFDLAGTVTTCGSRFYASANSPAGRDSALAQAMRTSGALITGKTHLHPLAYGITGQNAEYGDSLQPRDATLLTGGSSSGAAASVQEGSALAAIGTDTGGSIRVPAVLCGLTGFRASHSVASRAEQQGDLWQGGAHLAPSFDTVGFLLRDPRDAAPIAHALFGIPLNPSLSAPRVGYAPVSFLADAGEDVRSAYEMLQRFFEPHAASRSEFDPAFWSDSRDIFFPIQASEAAALHHGHFDGFESGIAQRLSWGESLGPAAILALRQRLTDFRARMASLFEQFELLILPCAPISRLIAAEDQSEARTTILRYTTPFSLTGAPVIALPGELIGGPFGTGIQIAAAPGKDAFLLAFAASLGDAIANGAAPSGPQ